MSRIVEDRTLSLVEAPSAEELQLSENAERVLRARYLIRDEAGCCRERPAQLYRRVAASIADAELGHNPDPENRRDWEERFYKLMATGRFMPNSPTLMNAGREMGMLSACFVLPVGDSIDAIFDSIKHTALIQKAGGGTGFAFDELRPTGDYISSSGGTTSGPISFWRAFSEATNAIQQGAFRRGANMGMMYIHHPDILKFLHAKQDLSQFTNYNISVKVTDEWMEAFRADPDAPHAVRNPRTGAVYYLPRDLPVWEYTIQSLAPAETAAAVNGARGRFYSRRAIWDLIVNHAWATGEPGVVFIDRVNRANPTPHVGRMEATNPCGEQPLLPYEACNLGSINLSRFVLRACTPQAEVDWDALRSTIRESARFLDNVIDVNRYPLPQISEICRANRKIGLGVMGFADALFKLGVAYNSEEGILWGERFMRFLNDEAHAYSEELAGQRGSFPNWKGSRWDTVHRRPMRNACCTTVAPTGTISILTDCSCGIEPIFSLVFYRNVLNGQNEGREPMLEVNRVFREIMTERGLFQAELLDRIATEGTLAHMTGVPDEIRRIFVCARDVSPEWHVRMQAAFQLHCDAGISKTINFPASATVKEVETIYQLCYELGCKGVTVYRDGCRSAQPMALKGQGSPVPPERKHQGKIAGPLDTEDGARTPAGPVNQPASLPDFLSSIRLRQMTPFGNMHVQVTVDPRNERELEVFAQLGKGGDLASSDLEAICRLISLWLRSGGELRPVIHQLRGIGSSLQVSTRDGKVSSLGDGLARALERYSQAKTRLGLRRLLLGAFGPAELHGSEGGKGGNGVDRRGDGNGRRDAVIQGKNTTGQGVDSQSPDEPAPSRKTTGGNGFRPSARGLTDQASATADDAFRPAAPTAVREHEAFKVLCPECGSLLRFSEGCCACGSCGYSHC